MGRRIAVLLVGLSICALTILVEAIYYLCGWLDWGTFFGLEAFKCIFAASCVDFFRKLRNKSFEARDGRRLEYDLWARYEPGVSENAEFLVDPRTMNRQLGAVYPTRLATLIIYLLSYVSASRSPVRTKRCNSETDPFQCIFPVHCLCVRLWLAIARRPTNDCSARQRLADQH